MRLAASKVYLYGRCRSCYATSGDADFIDFPGGKIPLTGQLSFLGAPQQAGSSGASRVPTYRTIDLMGRPCEGAHVPHPLSKELSVKMYETMARLQVRFVSVNMVTDRGDAML